MAGPQRSKSKPPRAQQAVVVKRNESGGRVESAKTSNLLFFAQRNFSPALVNRSRPRKL
jgi:hypothetical protein